MDAIVNFIRSWRISSSRPSASMRSSSCSSPWRRSASSCCCSKMAPRQPLLEHRLRRGRLADRGLVAGLRHGVRAQGLEGARAGDAVHREALRLSLRNLRAPSDPRARHRRSRNDALFLRRAQPLVVRWAPIRAVGTVLGIALAIHVAGPITDMVDGEPVSAHFARPRRASGTNRRSSPSSRPWRRRSRQATAVTCRRASASTEVSGYPDAEAGKSEIASPWTIGVKPLGASCFETLGHEGNVHDEAAGLRRRIQTGACTSTTSRSRGS